MDEVGDYSAKQKRAHHTRAYGKHFALHDDDAEAHEIDEDEGTHDRVEVDDAPPRDVLQSLNMYVCKMFAVAQQSF